MQENDLLQSIDRGLEPIGPNTKQMIYWKMLSTHDTSSAEAIISDPISFEHIIEELSGSRAVKIERLIVREIAKTFNLTTNEMKNMVTAIEAAKDQLIF